MSIRKIASQAAILLAMFLTAGFVFWMIVLPMLGMQMSDWDNANKSAQFMINHKSAFTIGYFFDWVFSVTTFVLAAAYTQRFSRRQPWLGIMIGGWGVVSTALFLLSGSLGTFGTQIAANSYRQGGGLAMAITVQQIQFIVSQTAVGAVGIFTFCVALASARTKTFASWINILGYITGAAYVLSLPLTAISPMAGMVSIIGLLLAIPFNLGVAMSFMKQPHEELTLAAAN
jgi:hypothetical protein